MKPTVEEVLAEFDRIASDWSYRGCAFEVFQLVQRFKKRLKDEQANVDKAADVTSDTLRS